MKIAKFFAGSMAVAAMVGLTGCVYEAPRPDASPGQTAPSNSSSAPTPSVSPSNGESPAPTAGSTAAPDPSSPGTKPAEANVQILDTRVDPVTSGVSVAGMVVNIVSDAGLCTATAEQGDVSVSATATSVADATVTYCASLVVPLPPGSTGEWIVTLSFDEGATHGTASSSLVVG